MTSRGKLSTWMILAILILASTCLHSEIKILVLDGVEGVWMPTEDLRTLNQEIAEKAHWEEAFSRLDIAYKDLSALYLEDEDIIKSQKHQLSIWKWATGGAVIAGIAGSILVAIFSH